ncbi:hypothetical protein [Almyronema epifaneia]|uniref:TonB C-terminal domain-containing protein n=1 Tax=Almyronema epifaneia S1 TaxID=2991925 RepID=A0ABW6IKW4_9CYAN
MPSSQKAEIPEPEPEPQETIRVTRLPVEATLPPPIAEPPAAPPPAPPRASSSPPAPAVATKVPAEAIAPRLETASTETDLNETDTAAEQTETETSETETSTGTEITDASPLEDKLKDIRFYSYSANWTTEGEATGRFSEWVAELSLNYGLFPTRLADPLVLPYEPTKCLSPEPVLASVGVIVDPAGQLVEEPELLKSTGYDILNQKALVEAQKQSFPAGNAVKAYSLEVQVQYDATSCVPPEG